MDKYHIYEEIGKGEFSQVFKGREKKKIEYVAIKRIEKHVMNKIVNEVQVMHKLKSAHMLKFHDWYETRNNLWLILEYCTGGDLESLIKQDGHLPETSVRIFGLDIIAAVKYLHNEGLIHCDIRPANFLVDEYGILKLADFKFARKIPSEPIGDTEVSTRGTPPYMAPELFTPTGVYSFQSDFWAVGCVLYQMRRGSLPFGETHTPLPTLIHHINNVEPVHQPLPPAAADGTAVNARLAHPPVTADLADLLQWLLERSPANRCTWTSVCSHPFWSPNNPSPPENRLAQPAFDAYCRELARTESHALEVSYIAEYGVRLDGSVDTGGHHGPPSQPPQLGTGTTPLKLDRTVEATAAAATASSSSRSSAQGQGGAAPSAVGIAIATSGASAGQRDSASRALSTPPQPTGAVANVHITPERNISAAQIAAAALANTQTKVPVGATTAAALEAAAGPGQTPGNGHKRAGLNNFDLPAGDAAFLQGAERPMTPGHAVTSNTTPSAATAPAPADHQTAATDLLSEFPVHTLLQHSSDLQVKSIAGNKQIEATEKLVFKPDGLPFPALSPTEAAQIGTVELETHLSHVYKAVQKSVTAVQTTIPTISASNALFDRLNLLGYLNSIAGCAAVADVVLNTSFLTVILKIMKNSTVFSTHTPGARSHTSAAGANALSSLVTTMNANALQARIWAATVLAQMLRYVSELKAPSIRQREEHIVPTIVAILRDNGKVDVRLKRRVVAALGETVFYICAQAEEPIADRWSLPAQAVETLTDCLREENDEIVKHYAVKTIENVFAQGAMEFRRRFVSLDLAVRLMELSQSSKNEHLQGSSGMAAAHLLHIVSTAHHYPPGQPGGAGTGTGTGVASPPPHGNLNATGRVAVNARGGSAGGAGGAGLNSTLNATAQLNDVFAIPGAARGAKFLAKVLERGGLPTVMEVLRDGPPKLQQAYLTIINLVFSAPVGPTSIALAPGMDATAIAAANSPANLQAINAALRMSRSFFLKSPTLLPLLINLIEQGGLSAIRGKALIAAQLISASSPVILASLAERRLSGILIRAIAPVLSAVEADPTKPLNTATLPYFCKCALATLGFLRSSCLSATTGITEQLSLLIANPTGHATGEAHSPGRSHRTSPGSPQAMHATPGAVDASTRAGGGAASDAALQAHATVLSAVASVASQPALRRLILSLNADVVQAFAETLQILPHARSALDRAIQSAQQANASKRSSSGPNPLQALAGLDEAVQVSEHACMIMLEMIAQSEFDDFSNAEAVRYLSTIASALIPAAAHLLGHHSGDTRVVVTSALRRLAPTALLACAQLGATGPAHSSLFSAALACLPELTAFSAELLVDQPPIPQYYVRLLVDVMSLSGAFAQAAVEGLVKNGAVEGLIRSLKPAANTSAGDDDGEGGAGGNPQLAVLLRRVFEAPDCGPLLLRCDIAPVVTEATIAAVYATMNEALCLGAAGTGPVHSAQLAEHFGSHRLSTHEGVVRLMDLVQSVLQFVVRIQPKDATASPQVGNLADQARRQVANMRYLSPAILTVVAYCSKYLRLFADDDASPAPRIGTEETATGMEAGASSVYGRLLDSGTRCIALLFDLFPDALTTQLLSKASILLETRMDGASQRGAAGLLSPSRGSSNASATRQVVVPPRAVVAEVLVNPQVEIKTRFRLMKILQALCRVAAGMNLGAQVKDMLTSPPLAQSLGTCSRASEVATTMRTFSGNMHVDDISAFVRLAGQLCELGSHL